MFTDEEKEYVLLAYYLGRQKLLNCIALQQLTRDLLDVFEIEKASALYTGRNVAPTVGCCICKEKENIFKDFWEYYFLKDHEEDVRDIDVHDVETAWSDIVKLWSNVEKYSKLLAPRKLILSYEDAGKALMKQHCVHIYRDIKERMSEKQNFGNWSRIIKKVQDELESRYFKLKKICAAELPAKTVVNQPDAGDRVRFAEVTVNVRKNSKLLAKYAGQCRSHGVEVTASGPTAVKIKYMICVKCSMEKDNSQPFSFLGFHLSYFIKCRQMSLGFEEKLSSNTKKQLPKPGNTRNGGFAPSLSSELKDGVSNHDNSNIKRKEGHQTELQRRQGISKNKFPSANARSGKVLARVPKNLSIADEKFRENSPTNLATRLEQIIAKFAVIHKLRQQGRMQSCQPQPNMPIMNKFKVWPQEYYALPPCSKGACETSQESDQEPSIDEGKSEDKVEDEVETKTVERYEDFYPTGSILDSNCNYDQHLLSELFPDISIVPDNPHVEEDKGANVMENTTVDNSKSGNSHPLVKVGSRVFRVSKNADIKFTDSAVPLNLDIDKKIKKVTIYKTPPKSYEKDTAPAQESRNTEMSEQKVEILNKVKESPTSQSNASIADDNKEDIQGRGIDIVESGENLHLSELPEVDNMQGYNKEEAGEFSFAVALYLSRMVPTSDNAIKGYVKRQKKMGKVRREPTQFHYLCVSSNAQNVMQPKEYPCSKMVKCNVDRSSLMANRAKIINWLPRYLGDLSRVILHEELLNRKQAPSIQDSPKKISPNKSKKSIRRKSSSIASKDSGIEVTRDKTDNPTFHQDVVPSIGDSCSENNRMPKSNLVDAPVGGSLGKVSQILKQFSDEVLRNNASKPSLQVGNSSTAETIWKLDQTQGGLNESGGKQDSSLQSNPAHVQPGDGCTNEKNCHGSQYGDSLEGSDTVSAISDNVGHRPFYKTRSSSKFAENKSNDCIDSCDSKKALLEETVSSFNSSACASNSEMYRLIYKRTEEDNPLKISSICHKEPIVETSLSQTFTGHLQSGSDKSICGLKRSCPDSTVEDNVLKKKYRRDENGNWNPIDKDNDYFKAEMPFNDVALKQGWVGSVFNFESRPLSKHMQMTSCAKVSSIRRMLVHRALDSCMDTNEKRKKAFWCPSRTILFFSNRIPSFEECGSLPVAPDPLCLVEFPKASKRAKLRHERVAKRAHKLFNAPSYFSDDGSNLPCESLDTVLCELEASHHASMINQTEGISSHVSAVYNGSQIKQNIVSKKKVDNGGTSTLMLSNLFKNLRKFWSSPCNKVQRQVNLLSLPIISMRKAEFAASALCEFYTSNLLDASNDDPSQVDHRTDFNSPVISSSQPCVSGQKETVSQLNLEECDPSQYPHNPISCTHSTLKANEDVHHTRDFKDSCLSPSKRTVVNDGLGLSDLDSLGDSSSLSVSNLSDNISSGTFHEKCENDSASDNSHQTLDSSQRGGGINKMIDCKKAEESVLCRKSSVCHDVDSALLPTASPKMRHTYHENGAIVNCEISSPIPAFCNIKNKTQLDASSAGFFHEKARILSKRTQWFGGRSYSSLYCHNSEAGNEESLSLAYCATKTFPAQINRPRNMSSRLTKAIKVYKRTLDNAINEVAADSVTGNIKQNPSYRSIINVLELALGRMRNQSLPPYRSKFCRGKLAKNLAKQNVRLSSALKFCFSSRRKTPLAKRRANHLIGRKLVGCNFFHSKIKKCRTIRKKTAPKLDDDSYWWREKPSSNDTKMQNHSADESMPLCNDKQTTVRQSVGSDLPPVDIGLTSTSPVSLGKVAVQDANDGKRHAASDDSTQSSTSISLRKYSSSNKGGFRQLDLGKKQLIDLLDDTTYSQEHGSKHFTSTMHPTACSNSTQSRNLYVDKGNNKIGTRLNVKYGQCSESKFTDAEDLHVEVVSDDLWCLKDNNSSGMRKADEVPIKYLNPDSATEVCSSPSNENISETVKTDVSDPDNHQSELPSRSTTITAEARKRKQTFDDVDSVSTSERWKSIIAVDEKNMQKTVSQGFYSDDKHDENLKPKGCIQSLFSWSLNCHLVTRAFFDSSNAKSFSLTCESPKHYSQRVFTWDDVDTPLRADEATPEFPDVAKEETIEQSHSSGHLTGETSPKELLPRTHQAYVALEPCVLARAKLNIASDFERTYWHETLPLVRSRVKQGPKGIGKANQMRLKWNSAVRGKRPKNIGIRTPKLKEFLNPDDPTFRVKKKSNASINNSNPGYSAVRISCKKF